MKFRKHLSKYSFCSYHKQDTININDSCRPRFYLLIGMTGHSLLDSDGRLKWIEIQTHVNHKKPSVLLIFGWEKNRKSLWIQMCFGLFPHHYLSPGWLQWFPDVYISILCTIWLIIHAEAREILWRAKETMSSLCSSSPTRPCPSDLYSLISYPYHTPFPFFLFPSGGF